jgi:hypothetical protein
MKDCNIMLDGSTLYVYKSDGHAAIHTIKEFEKIIT